MSSRLSSANSDPSNLIVIADVRPRPGSRFADHVEKIWVTPQYLISPSLLQQLEGPEHGISARTLSQIFARWDGLAVYQAQSDGSQVCNRYYFIQRSPQDGRPAKVIFAWNEAQAPLPIIVSAYSSCSDPEAYSKFRNKAGRVGIKFNYP